MGKLYHCWVTTKANQVDDIVIFAFPHNIYQYIQFSSPRQDPTGVKPWVNAVEPVLWALLARQLRFFTNPHHRYGVHDQYNGLTERWWWKGKVWERPEWEYASRAVWKSIRGRRLSWGVANVGLPVRSRRPSFKKGLAVLALQ